MAEIWRPRLASEVWVLVLEHRDGQDVTVHQTEAGARDYLLAYCQEFWREVSDAPFPLEEEEGVAEYFQASTDRYSINHCYIRNGR